METLGFFDPPPASWTSTPATPVTDPTSDDSTQTTELFEIPVGRHTKHVEPTGDLIKDIWATTELHAPSLVDWQPQNVSSAKLGRRNFRWPVVLGVTFAILAVAALGYWFYQRPDSVAAAARGDVNDRALALAEALDATEPVTDGLDDERLPEAAIESSASFDMSEAAREMFAASGELPSSDTEGRAAATDGAALAIDASRQLGDAIAYRTALEPLLTLPLLETNPALTDLTVATAAFTEWRAGFEATHAGLPDVIMGQTSAILDEIVQGLDATQTAYLDAMREGDRAGAVETIGELKAALSNARAALVDDMGELASSLETTIDEIRARIEPLIR